MALRCRPAQRTDVAGVTSRISRPVPEDHAPGPPVLASMHAATNSPTRMPAASNQSWSNSIRSSAMVFQTPPQSRRSRRISTGCRKYTGWYKWHAAVQRAICSLRQTTAMLDHGRRHQRAGRLFTRLRARPALRVQASEPLGILSDLPHFGWADAPAVQRVGLRGVPRDLGGRRGVAEGRRRDLTRRSDRHPARTRRRGVVQHV